MAIRLPQPEAYENYYEDIALFALPVEDAADEMPTKITWPAVFTMQLPVSAKKPVRYRSQLEKPALLTLHPINLSLIHISALSPVENTHIPCMAKSIPRNFSACLFSAVWFSQSNSRLAKYFPDGSLLTVTDFSFHSSGIIRWSFIFTGCIFGSFRNLSCRQIFPFTIFVV